MPATPSARSATAPCRPGDTALLLQAIGYALAVADAITPDLLSRPTPCQGWDLRKLLRHANESLAALLEAVGSGRVSPLPAAEESGADLAATFPDRAGRLAGACARVGRRHRSDQVIVIADRAVPLSRPRFRGHGRACSGTRLADGRQDHGHRDEGDDRAKHWAQHSNGDRHPGRGHPRADPPPGDPVDRGPTVRAGGAACGRCPGALSFLRSRGASSWRGS
jgi:Mycothiol maleylpyruvate isomerase N-terminal domain